MLGLASLRISSELKVLSDIELTIAFSSREGIRRKCQKDALATIFCVLRVLKASRSRSPASRARVLGLRPREIGLFQQIFKRCPQPKTMPQRYIYLFFGVLSIACLVSFLFLGVTRAKRKASDSSQPKLPFRRIPSNNQQLAALAKGRTHTFQPKASFSERKRQKDAKASLIPSLGSAAPPGSSTSSLTTTI